MDICPGTADNRTGHGQVADNRGADFEDKVGLVELPVAPALIEANRTTGRIYCRRCYLHGSEGSIPIGYCRSGRKPRCREGSGRRIWDMVLLPDTYFKYSLKLKMNRSLFSRCCDTVVFRCRRQTVFILGNDPVMVGGVGS